MHFFDLNPGVLRVFVKTLFFITTVFSPLLVTCGFQTIYSVRPFEDWEENENQKWLCRWQGVTQRNVMWAACTAPSLLQEKLCSTSISQVVAKGVKGSNSWFGVMKTRVQFSVSISLSLCLSHYYIKVRHSYCYKLIKHPCFWTKQLSNCSLQSFLRQFWDKLNYPFFSVAYFNYDNKYTILWRMVAQWIFSL
jgi:hypothetical protein